ncbi:glutathione S-transferase T3-like [Oryza brachyantha]|uniref:glutathione S-transferase T3-like n=1 Tax=Oryza brachyantha TaxID=4533 RepID=UPI00077677FC|nr:glutathione S-transferase T3-like [Oryza brachyantha]
MGREGAGAGALVTATDLSPQGGFINFLHDPETVAAMPQGGQPSTYPFAHPAAFPSQPPPAASIFPASCTQPTPADVTGGTTSASSAALVRRGDRVAANPEAGDDNGRQRMCYTHDEDLRLVSAWLRNSTNPIEGNAREGETYWTKVAEAYNETTPADRKREVHHLKGHWDKTIEKVSFFNGCYIQLRDAYAGGRSDMLLMDQALELYRSRQGHQFLFVHWWKEEPRSNGAPNCIKKAKKAKKGKGSASELALEVKEQLKNLVEAQASQKEELKRMKDLQQKLSDQRVEAATLQLKAAQERKEAKLIEYKNKTLETYNELLQVDTSKMEPWAKEAHTKVVTFLSDQIWRTKDSGPGTV